MYCLNDFTGNFGQKKSVFFLHLGVIPENNLKQTDWIHDNIYSFSETEVSFQYSDQLFE